MEADDQTNFHIELSRPCALCGHPLGYIQQKAGQLTTWCSSCDKYQYNTPHSEIGLRPPEKKKHRDKLKPSLRARVLRRWEHRCISCGAGAHDTPLHIAHLVPLAEKPNFSVEQAELLDHELNLVPMCPHCNLGYSTHPVALGLMVQALEMNVRDFK